MISEKKAFMLIELAIATLVIAIALTGLLMLARTGQRANSDATEEMRLTEFADGVMTTLRLLADRAAEQDETVWASFWVDLALGDTTLSQLPGFCGAVEEGQVPCIRGDNRVYTNFWPLAEQETADCIAHDYAIQYRIVVSSSYGWEIPIVREMTNAVPEFFAVTLHLWHGAFRSTQRAKSFFSIFGNKGRWQ